MGEVCVITIRDQNLGLTRIRVVRKPLSPRSGEYKQLWDGVNEEIKKTRGAGWKLRDDVEGKDFGKLALATRGQSPLRGLFDSTQKN